MTARARNAAAAAVLAVFVAAVALAARGCGAEVGLPAVYRHESGDLLFTYHPATGTENLFDVAADPRLLRDLTRERPADLARLRDEFLRRNGIRSLDELREPDRDLVDRLRGNGYFR